MIKAEYYRKVILKNHNQGIAVDQVSTILKTWFYIHHRVDL
jgi:hypothetical protein